MINSPFIDGYRLFYWESAAAQLIDVLGNAQADTTTLQEILWTENGPKKVNQCVIFYGGHINEHKLSVGYVTTLRHRVLVFTKDGI